MSGHTTRPDDVRDGVAGRLREAIKQIRIARGQIDDVTDAGQLAACLDTLEQIYARRREPTTRDKMDVLTAALADEDVVLFVATPSKDRPGTVHDQFCGSLANATGVDLLDESEGEVPDDARRCERCFGGDDGDR